MLDSAMPTSADIGEQSITTVVTGCSGGLGSEIVSHLQSAGYRIIGVDLKSASEPDEMVIGNVGSSELWHEVSDLLARENVRLRGLVNCAGASTRTTITSTSTLEWHRVLDSNLTSTWLGMKACYPHFEPNLSSIVNVGSIYGRLPPPGPPNPPTSPAYQAAKAGIVALTRAGASEFGSAGIRVNCVEPGLFSTPLTQSLNGEEFASRLRPVAMGREGNVSELASVVEFLLSDKASYINGATIGVDGGYPLCL